jgi:hypothetical protein
MSLRNRFNKKPGETAEERMAAEVAEAEARGDRFNLPSPSSRAGDGPDINGVRSQMSANERTKFVSETPYEPQTADEMKAARLKRKAEDISKGWQAWAVSVIKAKQSLQDAWQRATGQKTVCPFLKNIDRGDPTTADTERATAAMRAFADSELFAPWRERNKKNTERFKAMISITTGLQEFITLNWLDAQNHNTWGISFNILRNAGMIPPPLPPVVVEPAVVIPSEAAEQKYKARVTEIVVYDPLTNIGYSEFDLEHNVDAQTELRLRRLMEGNIGNERYQEYMKRQDEKARQASETNRIAAQEMGRQS